MTSDSLGDLGEKIRQLARVPTLLVASDYDGTLAPLVDDPMSAVANRDAAAAMRSLAELSNTHVAAISGRSLRDLATLSRFPEEIRLVGSHGSEFDLGFASQLSPELSQLRHELTRAVQVLGEKYSALVEEKPSGVAFHLRRLSDDDAVRARDELIRGPASWDGVHTRTGHDVLEMSVVETNKGTALNIIRAQVGATAVVFLGDDVTDEDAFATLQGPDVGVKVGAGLTAAPFRVKDTDTVAKVLALLCELRSEWLRGAGLVAIEDHSMLSDLRTAAIVTPAAKVTWLCVPRIDSAAVFSELLGGPSAGYFSIAPEPRSSAGDSAPIHQRYVGDTLVLESTFPTFTVTDYLDSSNGRTARPAGRSDLIRTIEGSGTAIIEFAPRLDFGRVPTQLQVSDGGISVMGTADLMVLRAPQITWEIVPDGVHQSARGTVELTDEPVVLELRLGTNDLGADPRCEPDRRDETMRFWTSWTNKLVLPPDERELAARSALTLKGLCHGPTGAIVAAATTSLPEHLGGTRNWDHRYCWLRNAAFSASALVALGSHDEALALLDWISGILAARNEPDRLAPLYNVTGRHLPPEGEITELSGYGGSRPVRVGNAADGQIQLDAFGSIVELVHLLAEEGAALSSEHWHLVEAMVLAVSRRWQEPDHSLWEIRAAPRHHVYSKVMCWLTVDRAIALADRFVDRAPDAWLQLRDRIAADVLDNGWNEGRGSFTAVYGGDELDASVLVVGLSGLLAPDDERFTSTVSTVETELRNGPTVYRYVGDDGLPGREGGFHFMTSWLIDALVLVGRTAEAVELFDQLKSLVGKTGLMSEEFDPENNRALGNIPQAYSHVGLIRNTLTLGR
jgi:trehalose-phosphatase